MRSPTIVGAILCAVLPLCATRAGADGCPDSRRRFDGLRAALEAEIQGETNAKTLRALQSARAAVLTAGTEIEPAAAALATAAKGIEKRVPGREGVDAALAEVLAGLLDDGAWELQSLQIALGQQNPAVALKMQARIQASLDQAGALAGVSVAKAAKALAPAARLMRDLRIPPSPTYGGPMRLVGIHPSPNQVVGLNQAVTWRFSGRVVPSSIRADTVPVRIAPNFASQVFGAYEVVGNTVVFHPRYPSLPDSSDAGYPVGTRIRASAVGYPSLSAVLGPGNRPLAATASVDFLTAGAGGLLYDYTMYRDPPPSRLRCTDPVDVLPATPYAGPAGAQDVPTTVVPVLRMNRCPIDPATLGPRVSLRCVSLRGVPVSIPIPGTATLDQGHQEVRISFQPAIRLADASRYALRIDPGVTDLTGQFDLQPHEGRTALYTLAGSAVDPALTAFAQAHPEEVDPRTYLVFTTREEAPQDLLHALRFDGSDVAADGGAGLDPRGTTASFNGDVAGAVAATVVGPGGDGSLGDLKPVAGITLNTGSPQAVNGAFNFRRIEIPPGVTVLVTGPLPAVLRASEGADVKGGISVAGGAGQGSEISYNTSALPLSAGGAPGPGGAAGGGSSTSSAYSLPGGSGADASGIPGSGGTGGYEVASTSDRSSPGGGAGGGHKYAGANGANGAYGAAPGGWNGSGGIGGASGGIEPTSTATQAGRQFLVEGGAGGGAGGNNHYVSAGWRTGAAGGGGGGGALLLVSQAPVQVSGTINARGGAGGANLSGQADYGGAAGGGGAGGAIAIYSGGTLDVTGATLDASGGAGGTSGGNGWVGRGGVGGGGYVRLESRSGSVTGAAAALAPDYSTGVFDPAALGADPASVFTGSWFDTRAMDPRVGTFLASHFVDQDVAGCTIRYEMQMAGTDAGNPLLPDTGALDPVTGDGTDVTRASPWVEVRSTAGVIQDPALVLNGHGYRFYRVRISFQLKEGIRRSDGLPYVDEFRIPFRIE